MSRLRRRDDAAHSLYLTISEKEVRTAENMNA
jgi:hypothetical protein